ncbi:MAG TPA: hypothetical protein VEU32_14415 [Burkholderiales bacterium]|nr:hypothetical protein [Burkholderiales bacterium]
MVFRCAIVLMLALALASCSLGRRSTATTTQPDADTATRPALTQAHPPEASNYMLTPGAGVGSPVPAMEPGRKINVQDCKKDINLTAGNLKCQ